MTVFTTQSSKFYQHLHIDAKTIVKKIVKDLFYIFHFAIYNRKDAPENTKAYPLYHRMANERKRVIFIVNTTKIDYTFQTKTNKTAFRQGFRDGTPIGLGYFAVSFSLGIVARNAGLSPSKDF